ncbi:hypothetical protein GCM10009760_08690 [Kitasatospora kazusensis]|uniref:Uncharacterized protein n=1 Tax=Kitasatospora kazusensis TaxID=407974 RepID=A0ABN2YVP1_9ACTN
MAENQNETTTDQEQDAPEVIAHGVTEEEAPCVVQTGVEN